VAVLVRETNKMKNSIKDDEQAHYSKKEMINIISTTTMA
jgi:hypothetical protein